MITIIKFILQITYEGKLGSTGFYPIPIWLRKYLKKFPVAKQVAIYSKLAEGADMSRLAPDEYGCEESRTRLLRMIDQYLTPVFTYTPNGLRHMIDSDRFIEVDEKLALMIDGTIVMAATGTGFHGTVGHTGILVDGRVWSNNSATGMWGDFWSLVAFKRNYQYKQGMRLRYFVPI